MDIKYVSLEEITGGVDRIRGVISEDERHFPLKLETDTGTIYMNASEREMRNMLQQITEILEK